MNGGTLPVTFDDPTNPTAINVAAMPAGLVVGESTYFTIRVDSNVNSWATKYTLYFNFVDPCTSATITDNSGGGTTSLTTDYLSPLSFATDFSIDPADCPMTELVYSCTESPTLTNGVDCDAGITVESSTGQAEWAYDSSDVTSIPDAVSDIAPDTYTVSLTARLPNGNQATQTVDVTYEDPCLAATATVSTDAATDPLDI